MANAIINVGQTGGQINISTATAPATPAAGVVTLYAGTDKALHALNSDGTDITIAAAAAASPITVQQTNSLVSTVIGATATSTATGSVVIGATACAVGSNSVVIGTCANTAFGNSIVIGLCAVASGSCQTVIGECACSTSQRSVVMGLCSRSTQETNLAIGPYVCNTADRSVAVGSFIANGSSQGITIGYDAINSGGKSVNIGSKICTDSVANCSVSLGVCGCNQSSISVLTGFNSRIFCGATGTIVLGASSVGGTGACNSVVLGNNSQALTSTSIVIGQGAKDKSTTGGTLVGAIVIGRNACICAGNAYNGHIVIGNNACGYEQNSVVAIGDTASAENIGVAIGCIAQAGTASVALGGQSIACGLLAVSVGRFSRAIAQESMALGYDSCGCCTKSISIGSSSRATHVCAVALGPGITTEKANTTHVNSLIAYGQAASKAHTVGSTGGSVTVDFDNSNVQTITLTSNITTLTKSNPIDGGVYTLFLTQGGTGGKTVSFGADVFFAGGAAPTLSTAAGATDAVSLVYVAGVTGYYGNANLNFA